MTDSDGGDAEVERLSRLVEHTYDLLVIVGADGGVLDVNPATSQRLGYTREESLSMNAVDIVDPNDLPRAAEHFASALSGASNIEPLDVRILRKDGQWRWFETRVDPIDDTSFALNAREVTERRRASTILESQTRVLALLKQHAPLSEIVATAGEGIRSVIDDGRVAVVFGGSPQLVWAPDLPASWGSSLTVGLQGVATAVEGLDALLRSMAVEHDLPEAHSTPVRLEDGSDVGRILVYRTKRRPLPDALISALDSFADVIAVASEVASMRRLADAGAAQDI